MADRAAAEGRGRGRLRLLAADIQAALRSGVAVPSLARCLEELLLNSLEAGCGCAAARVNAQAGRVQVADNGAGLERAALELAGTRYCSGGGSDPGAGVKKDPGAEGGGEGPGNRGWTCPRGDKGRDPGGEDDNNPKHLELPGPGGRGEALASIAHLSGLLEIVSRPQGSSGTWVKLFRNGHARPVYKAEMGRPSPGTTVTVCNLFYQLPVRQRRLGQPMEWEQIRCRVQALSYLYPGVSFTVRDEASSAVGGSLVVRLPKVSNLQARFAQIHGPQQAATLGCIQHSSNGIQLSGFISRQGHHNKAQRLIFVNRRLVLKTRIHKELDSLLKRRSLICRPEPGTGSRGGSDLHPVYIININCDRSQYDACWETNRTLLEFTDWNQLLSLLEEGVQAFLRQEQLLVDPIEEQIPDPQTVASLDFRFSHERVAVQSKSVHRQVVVPGNPKLEAGSEPCQGQVCNDTKELALHAQTATRDKPPLEKEESIFLRDLSTSNSSQTQPTEQIQSSTALCQLTAVNENTILSVTESPSQVEKLAETGIGKPVGESQGEQVRDSQGERVGESQGEQAGKSQGEQVGESQGRQSQGESQGQQVEDGEKLGESRREQAGEWEQMGESQEEQAEASQGNWWVEGLHGEQELEVKWQKDEVLGGKKSVKLGMTGLITHIVPGKTIEVGTSSGNSSDRGQVCRPGPVSAWEILNEKMRKGDGQLMPDDQALSNISQKSGRDIPQGSVTACQKIPNTHQSHCTSGSFAESMTISQKMNLPQCRSSLENRNPANCKPVCCQARFHRKLGMSLITGSLDVFRRNYGKISDDQDAGGPSQGSVTVQDSTGEATERPSRSNVTVILETERLHQNTGIGYAGSVTSHQSENLQFDQCDCSGLLRNLYSDGTFPVADCVARAHSTPIATPGYSQAKQTSPASKEPRRTLATKLSKLKDLKGQPAEDKSAESKAGSSIGTCQPCESFRDLYPEQQCPTLLQEHSAAQVSSENSPFQERRVTEADWQEDSNTATSERVQFLSNSTSCVVKLPWPTVDERTDNGTDVHSDLQVGDQSQDDRTGVNLSPFTEDFVSMQKMSEPVYIQTKSIDAEQFLASCVEDCKGQSDSLKHFPSDWLQYFDGSLGKTVYVNSMTGLSSYDVPPDVQTEAACVRDFTTMPVNVLTKTGFQYQCYPFRSHSLIPFLPRSHEERQKDKSATHSGSNDSLRSLFREWTNPVFPRPPEVAVDVSNDQAGSLAVKIHNILYPYRFTKDMIGSLQVLNQVDNKFIACLIETRTNKEAPTGGNLLVLVDQHAAHERVRLEQLLSDCYERIPDAAGQRKLCSSIVCPPMEISCTQDEIRLLRLYRKHLEAAGLQVEFRDAESPVILIKKVPACFIEKEANEVRRGRHSVTQTILKEFLQEQIEMFQSTGGFQGVLSRTVLKVLSSQACRGAVKFGDGLNVEECRSLMDSLAGCDLPFQCAHGRPSILPLVDLDHLGMEKEVHHRPNLQKLHQLCEARFNSGSI
ncbi:DNA mismatch repair protein Mlh3 [Hemiscyllium ocellatum]|uniref:DNA mismatch repair protein Mlh3 n=1 Tax=Hemiscyllium ocellatum TaxID=170820 RepID=UPI0029671D7B|nr:DNA mismatch repair protein Mlh3 [Hemiscyllium ocellatum]